VALALIIGGARARAQEHPAPADGAQQPPAGHEMTTEQMEAGPRLMLHGFSNVDYAETTDDATPGGFQLGQFVLHMSSSLGTAGRQRQRRAARVPAALPHLFREGTRLVSRVAAAAH
jgi:hypothetical protein